MNNIIDLDALSTQARTDMPSLQAMFAVAGDTLTATVQDRWNLVIHALIRMALGGDTWTPRHGRSPSRPPESAGLSGTQDRPR
jgi:hypothetical protein